MERLRMKGCPVSSGRQECQKKESGQQEVPTVPQVMPADQGMPAGPLELQRDQLTVLASQHEVPSEGLAVPAPGQDAITTLQEVQAGEQDMLPVLLKVLPGEQDRLPVLHENSPAGQGKMSTLQDMLQLLQEKMKT
jgi:hypothetical protein